jgi:hypothetical protein
MVVQIQVTFMVSLWHVIFYVVLKNNILSIGMFMQSHSRELYNVGVYSLSPPFMKNHIGILHQRICRGHGKKSHRLTLSASLKCYAGPPPACFPMCHPRYLATVVTIMLVVVSFGNEELQGQLQVPRD